MGSCVSVRKDADSVLKLRLSFGSKTDNKLVIPPFPVKDDKLSSNGDRPIADPPLKSQWSPSQATANATTFRDCGKKPHFLQKRLRFLVFSGQTNQMCLLDFSYFHVSLGKTF